MKHLIKYSGVALVMAGLFFIITNVVISPLVDFDAAFSEVLSSSVFQYRMIFAALTVVFLLFGVTGLYLHHNEIERASIFRHITFIIAFFGSAFVFANEWHQIFVLPEIAKMSPEAMEKLDSSENTGSYVIGAMIALVTFSIGWILFMISLLISRKLKRLGPILVLSGFFLIPIISGIITPKWGGVIGTAVLGIGFCIIGFELIKSS